MRDSCFSEERFRNDKLSAAMHNCGSLELNNDILFCSLQEPSRHRITWDGLAPNAGHLERCCCQRAFWQLQDRACDAYAFEELLGMPTVNLIPKWCDRMLKHIINMGRCIKLGARH